MKNLIIIFICILCTSVLFSQETAEPAQKVYLIEVSDQDQFMVDTSLATHIKTKLEQADDADIVIFEIDTYGGQLKPTSEIREAIMDYVKSHDARVISYIPKKAVSAGALITVSCPEIIMHKEAHFGDCAPVMATQEGPKMLNDNDKITSVLRTDFKTACRTYNYPYRLGHAMVSENFATYVAHETSKLKIYSFKEYGSLPEIEREKISGKDIPSRTEFFFPSDLKEALKQKKDEKADYIFPDADSIKQPVYIVIDEVFEVNGTRKCFLSQSTNARKDFQSLSKAEEEFIKQRFLHMIDDDSEMVELTGEDAYKYHFAKRIVNDRQDLYSYLGVSETDVRILDPSRAETAVRWLNQPIIMGFLIMVAIIAIYAELHTPGFGLAGIISVVCFCAYFLISFLAYEPHLLPVILFFLGIVLMLLEIFVIPGFGVAGIMGILLLITGLMTVRMPEGIFTPGKSMEWRMGLLSEPLGIVFGGLVAGFIGCMIIARYLPEMKWFSKHVVAGPDRIQTASEGGVSVANIKTEVNEKDVGMVASDLRPSGKVEINGRRLTAVSNGDYIEKGNKVRVVKVKGNQIIVEKI